MKKQIGAVISTLIFTFVIVSCNENNATCGKVILSTPIAYNDFIVDRQNEIIQKMVKLNKLYAEGTNKEISWHYKELIACTDSNLNKIKILTPYENDSTLKLKALNLIAYYSKIFHNEYIEVVDIFLEGYSPSDAEMDRIYNIIQDVKKNETELNTQLTQAQLAFAKKHGFEFSNDTGLNPPDVNELKETTESQ
jgi:hypothetical protein